MIVFCPGCGSRISVQPATPGGDVECPRCHSTFSTAGLKEAPVDAQPPKKFKAKKSGRSRWVGVGIVLLVLLVLGGGAAGVLYFTGTLGRWFGGTTGPITMGTTKQPTWQEYVNPEGRFRVLFPGTPDRELVHAQGRSKGRVLATTFTVETPDVSYAVAYEDLDAKVKTAEQLVEQHRGEAAAGKAGKLVSDRDVTVGTHRGKELVIQLAGGGTAHIRYVAAGERLYKLTVLGRKQTPDPAAVAKFFDSFQLTG